MTVAAALVRPLAAAVVAACLLPNALRADDFSVRVATAVDGAFRPLLDAYRVPGMAVAVTVDGRRSNFTYGVASKETGAPVTVDTLFELGSVSKVFTATLVAYAQVLGKLSLDDRPGDHMPELRGSAIDEAHLLELGTYTAGGLPLQFPDAVTDEAGMIGYFRGWRPSAAPGAVRLYSNPSIGLLGHIAGLAMDGDFAGVAEAELFPRLGLSSTFIRVPQAAMARYAFGYAKADRPIRVNPGVFDAEAYGVKSTAADMIRFVEANLRPETLEAPMRRAVEGTHVGHFRIGGMVQGLGWEQHPFRVGDRARVENLERLAMTAQPATRETPPGPPSEPTLFEKTGSTNGFGAYAAFVPARKIGIVMLANRNFPIPARVKAALAVLEALTEEPRR